MPRATKLRSCLLLASLVPGAAAADVPKPASDPSPSRHAKEFKIDRQDWTAEPGLVAGIKRIELRNDYGDVRARSSYAGLLEVHSVVQRLGEGPDDVGVNVARHEEVLAINVTYPPGRTDVAKPRLAKDEIDRCDMVVYVPPGVAFSAQSLRGIVEARNLQGDVSASTLEGEIRVSTSGTIRARSRDGGITVVFPRNDERRGVSLLESESGAISVTFPSGSHLDLRADTAGAITGNLAVQAQAESGRRRLSFRSGPGSHSLLVRSDRGDVDFYQSDQ